jgi:cleavage and polyadenylation specificity factor subunit 1
MTQDVSFGASNSESNYGTESALALSVSIADPYVLLRMSDGSVRLLVGGKFLFVTSVKINYSYQFY